MSTDDGTGLLGTAAGLVMVVAFLLLAIDTGLTLLVRSTVGAAATDAATIVARAAGPDGVLTTDELEAATVRARDRVDALAGSAATMSPPSFDGRSGSVTVTVRRPGPRTFAALRAGSATVERSATVRLEVLR
ncbi:MAG: hypothetical protein FJW83_05410 [Actinobacteria bacterium]|nr:hypothetical protein [Actinomycetota bacterium]